MKQTPPNHRTRRTVARKAAYRKGSKPVDLNQLSERLSRLRFNLHKAIADALNRQLHSQGSDLLNGTKYVWLKNPDNWHEADRSKFDALRFTLPPIKLCEERNFVLALGTLSP